MYRIKTYQCDTHQTCAVSGRIADLGSRKDRKLALDTDCSLVGWCDDVQRSDALAVQTGVLCETLEILTRGMPGFSFIIRRRFRDGNVGKNDGCFE